ncbi:MAG: ATP-binding protein [Myxococcota bacterium]|nr:ATP-binding protein [Myxococcota bacterium]
MTDHPRAAERSLGADLTDCDKEPIHTPGFVQPHGALLVLAKPDLRVLQCSANLETHCGVEPSAVLGRPLSDAFEDVARAVASVLADPDPTQHVPLPLTIAGARFDGLVHRHDGVVLLELEPALPEHVSLEDALRVALRRLEVARTMPDLFELTVTEIRRITGFDRVIVYRFDDDGHGEVVAEARRESIDPYLGLHYPASDIPEPARELYRRNWLRIIPDARYVPVPIVPTLRPDTKLPLDLSGAALRSVSPVHLEYMANMGVLASMSVSLLVNGKLWGLVSCAHLEGPKRLPYRIRAVCEALGRLVSLQIAALREVEARREREARRGTLMRVLEATKRCDDVFAGLADAPDAVLEVAGAGGAAVVVDGACIARVGTTPARRHIEQLVDMLAERGSAPIFVTRALGRAYEPARSFTQLASGVLAVSIPRPSASYLLWFRPEQIEHVSWGGNPEKPVEPTKTRLHPRRSFAEWRETVRGTSQRWSEVDVDLAIELRTQLIEIDLERQVLRERAAVRARDQLVAVVSHDLRTPLGVVQMQTQLLAAAMPSPTPEQLRAAIERIRRSTASMTQLVEDLLDTGKLEAERFAVAPEDYDADALIDEALALVQPFAERKSITIEPPAPSGIRVRADAVRMYQVLSNIVGNAIKYTPEGGRVRVTLEARDAELEVSISDTGPGLAPDVAPQLFDRYWRAPDSGGGGFGLGMFIARGIVEAHGGRIWASCAPGQGLTVSFTLPLAQGDQRA